MFAENMETKFLHHFHVRSHNKINDALFYQFRRYEQKANRVNDTALIERLLC